MLSRDGVFGSLDHQHRATNPSAQLEGLILVEDVGELVGDQGLGEVSRPQPTQSSIGLVECGSLNIWEKKNSRKPW